MAVTQTNSNFFFNQCVPAFDMDMNGHNVQVGRKMMVLEIFLIYLIYLAAITIGTIKNKYRECKN